MKVEYKNYSINVNFDIVPENNHNILRELYISMFKIFEELEQIISPQRTLLLTNELENIEYKMQEIFGFPQNRKFHRYWLKIPTCICPKLDNYEYYGTQFRLTTNDCPIHGDRIKKFIKRKEKIKRIIWQK